MVVQKPHYLELHDLGIVEVQRKIQRLNITTSY